MSASPFRAAAVRRVGGPVLYRLARLAGGPPPGLRRGRALAPSDVPTVVVVLVGAEDASAAAVLEHVARAQWATDAFTPVFVVDAPVLAPFRRAGYVAELVGPAGRGAAVAEARRSYAADLVVVVDPSSRAGLDWLESALLDVDPTAPGPLERGRRLLRRVEARLR